MTVTMNGYPRIDAIDGRLPAVGFGSHSTHLLAGAVAAVLVEVGRRFDAEVEPVVTFNGWRSVIGNTGSGGIANSNHMSGTAVDINGGKHPRYVHGTFTAAQMVAIRRILADLGGVVRWGGDWNGDTHLTETNTDEMHFEVVAPLASVTTVANQIGHTGTVPTIPTVTPPADLKETDMPLDQADKDTIYQLVRDLTAQSITTALDGHAPILNNQTDKETIDRLIVDRLAQALAPIAAAIASVSAGNVDYAALAKAVNDDAAKRLQS